jgi:hypothetical protein
VWADEYRDSSNFVGFVWKIVHELNAAKEPILFQVISFSRAFKIFRE